MTYCSKHGIDYPNDSFCVLCYKEREREEMYEPDEDATYVIGPSLWNHFKKWLNSKVKVHLSRMQK